MADNGLRNLIAQERSDATSRFAIDSTPTFLATGAKGQHQHSGEMSYDDFVQFIAAVS